MKRRNFLKSIIGAASITAVPSMVLANTKTNHTLVFDPPIKVPVDRITIRAGLPEPALRALNINKTSKDNTSIWNVKWGKEGVDKLYVFGESSNEIEGDWQGFGDRYK